MRHLKTFASAIAIVAVLVMATDYVAMAATGKPLILGKVNKSGKTTTIKSAKGAALKLKVDEGTPPLKVNSDTLVKQLNAAKVGGKSASELGVRVRADTVNLSGTATTEVTQVFPGIAAGTYRVDYTLWLDRNVPSTAYCFVLSSENDFAGYASSPNLDNTNAIVLSGVGILKFSASGSASLICRNGAASNVSTFDGSYMMFTPVSQSGATLPRKSVQGRSSSGGPAE